MQYITGNINSIDMNTIVPNHIGAPMFPYMMNLPVAPVAKPALVRGPDGKMYTVAAYS